MTVPAPRCTILVCDDDPLICAALRDVLDAEPDLDVVAVARDADEAIALAVHHRPAVAVLDVRMPGGGGARIARELADRLPGVRMLAFSAYGDTTALAEMRRAGVSEYLLKGARNREIVAAVRRLGGYPQPDHG